jgi:hypothetical protein
MAEVKYLYLSADIADFQGFNPIKFTAQYLADYRAAIDAAIAFTDDETVVDMGQERTQEVAAYMEEARTLYKHIKYFVEEAYPNNVARKNRFGLDNYEESRKSPVNMVAFLTQLHTQGTVFLNNLTTVGLQASKIADILALRNKLQVANAAQKAFTGERQELTQLRAKAFAQMDNFTQAICKAGKLIFEGDFAKYRQYTIYKTSDTATVPTHTISPTSTEVAFTDDSNPIADTTAFLLENEGDSTLTFYTNTNLSEAAPANVATVEGNSSVEITAGEMAGSSFAQVVVRNDSQQQGRYRIRRLEEVV